jgi:hypothetical protein
MLIIILICFAICFIIEKVLPGWKLPAVPTWTIRVLAINFVQLLVVVAAGYSWEKWLSSYSAFHLSQHVPNWLGGIIAYLLPHLFFTGGTGGVIRVIFCGGIFTRYTTAHSVSR